MKDIIITRQRQRTEVLTLLVCFVVAFGLNVYAIVAYGGQWKELFWSLGFVALATAILYVAWTLLRLVVYGCKRIIKKNN